MLKIRQLAISIIALGVGQIALAAEPLSLTSASFKDGATLSVRNAGNLASNPNCIGENISPPLSWSNVPAGTKSLVLLMFDPEGRNGLGVSHLVSYGISPNLTGFAEGEISKPGDKFVGGKNTQGLLHYGGPCIPLGIGSHHYTFTLIATDLEPGELTTGLTREGLLTKLVGRAKAATGLVGLFERR